MCKAGHPKHKSNGLDNMTITGTFANLDCANTCCKVQAVSTVAAVLQKNKKKKWTGSNNKDETTGEVTIQVEIDKMFYMWSVRPRNTQT